MLKKLFLSHSIFFQMFYQKAEIIRNGIKAKLFILCLLLSSGLYAFETPRATEGIFDLRNSFSSGVDVFSLNGAWEFYWNNLLEPEDFLCPNPPKPDIFGKVPSYWTDYTINAKSLPQTGFATYRLKILLPDGFKKSLAFDVPVFDSSFKLFINGKSYGGNGIVGTTLQNSIAGYKPYLVVYEPESDTLDIIIQASNFQHRRGGFWKQMKIGLAGQVELENSQYILTSHLSMGILMAFSLFFLFFFIFYRKDLMPLLFSVFLAGIFLRLISTGVYPISLLSGVSWDWIVRIEYLGMYVGIIAGLWFLYLLYPVNIMKSINYINTVILLIFCLTVLFTRVGFFAYTMIYFQIMMILYLLFYLVFSFISIFKKGSYNIVYFAGFLMLMTALMNDIVLSHSKGGLTKDYTIHIAVQIFVFIHAIMLIRTWIKAFIEKERLNKEIEYMNANLEKIIAERTSELLENSREIAAQHEKIANQNELLKAEIGFKNRVFSIIAHDLKTPISSLLLFFDVIKKDTEQSIKDSTLKSIHNLVISVNSLIDNLLYWGRSQGNQIPVKNREIDVELITRKVLELFIEPASQKSIDLNFNNEGVTKAYCDPELLQIIIRNLISNALKFTNEGGNINVNLRQSPADKFFIELSVSDNGVGMPEEKISALLSGGNPESSYGTKKEKGTGLGLRLCFDLVRLVNGKMEMSNQKSGGTKVSIFFPVTGTDE